MPVGLWPVRERGCYTTHSVPTPMLVHRCHATHSWRLATARTRVTKSGKILFHKGETGESDLIYEYVPPKRTGRGVLVRTIIWKFGMSFVTYPDSRSKHTPRNTHKQRIRFDRVSSVLLRAEDRSIRKLVEIALFASLVIYPACGLIPHEIEIDRAIN